MSEISTLLAETCSRLFADLVTADSMRDTEAGAWPGDLWSVLEENGLTRALVPEAQGGTGVSWLDAAPILHAAGYYSAPVPLVETVVAGWLLAQAGVVAVICHSTNRTSRATSTGCRGVKLRHMSWRLLKAADSRSWFCWRRTVPRQRQI
jgi:alkylation response protein AidB-like acyl-CoA dehydrogenase